MALATGARGRKSGGKTQSSEILARFDQMLASGQVGRQRGAKAAAARALKKRFPDYAVRTIGNMIALTYRQWAKNSQTHK